ncbi:MAG: hypothetical protein LBS74_03675 [Oscillospiraceae bacterium]|jgi:hypothetical protein|nr:hypothetical protein [Oscillospiraceae bacterium]
MKTSEELWSEFATTGSVNAYLKYKKADAVPNTSRGNRNANNHRRPDSSGAKLGG